MAYRADRPVLGRGAHWEAGSGREKTGRKERKRKHGDMEQLTADFWVDFWS